MKENHSDFILFKTEDEKISVDVRFCKNETIWLTQQKFADLFGVKRPAITRHLKNIFETGELKEEVVSSILEHSAWGT